MRTSLSIAFRFMAWTALAVFALAAGPAMAKPAAEINAGVDEALAQFNKEVKTGSALLDRAAGVLVFPKVIKAGIGVGGEYGEGALRVGGKTVDYYSTAAASWGLQLGAQAKTVILVFLEQDALNKFRNSSGWEIGVDGSVALVEVGAGGSLDTTKLKEPIVGFVIGQKGLMYNLTLEGTKMTKIVRE